MGPDGSAQPHAAAKLAVLISGNVLMTFMISAVMPASGAIAEHFSALGHIDLRAQAVVLAPYIAMLFAAPLTGMVIQRLGRRGPLLAALALYAVSGAAQLLIDGFWPLVIARIALGAGGGAVSTICMTLAGDYFTGARQTWAVALVGMATAPGSVIVILVAGVLVDWGSWHMAFTPYLLAIPVLIMAWLVIREPDHKQATESRGGNLPRFFWIFCIITVCEACISVLPAIQLPFLLIGIGARHATTASLLIAASSAVAVVTGTLYPMIRRYVSVDHMLVLICLAAALSYLGLSMANGVVSLGLAMLVIGFPVGLMIPHFSAVTIERASVEARGRAVGLITGAIVLGQILIPFLSEPLRALLGTKGMFGALALVLLGAAIIASAAPLLWRSQIVRN
jgi:MFS family permease